MPSSTDYAFDVNVRSEYLDEESSPETRRYVFAYTIRIYNTGRVGARLTHRQWLITDGDGHQEEVRGEGVVGEQPHLDPGEAFEYVSGVILETDLGTMQGSYVVVADDGTEFEAQIPAFTLAAPRTLH